MNRDWATSDDGEQARQEQRNQSRRRRAEADLREVLSTVEGRRFVWALMQDMGLLDMMPLEGAAAVEKGAQRNFAISLRARIERLDPDEPLSRLHEMERDFEAVSRDEDG